MCRGLQEIRVATREESGVLGFPSRPLGFSAHGILHSRILKWVAVPFSRGSSQPRDQTHVSCIAGGFFTTEPPGKSHKRRIPLAVVLPRPGRGAGTLIPSAQRLVWAAKQPLGSVVSDSLQPHELYNPWNSPGQNTGVRKLSLLQGLFPTQGSNTCLLHCRWILYY